MSDVILSVLNAVTDVLFVVEYSIPHAALHVCTLIHFLFIQPTKASTIWWGVSNIPYSGFFWRRINFGNLANL